MLMALCKTHKKVKRKDGVLFCAVCGVYFCECGGTYSRMDLFWKSRKWCDKNGEDYVDYSNDEMMKTFGEDND